MIPIPQRTLGTPDLTVPALGLGCMGMSRVLRPAATTSESIATIHRALDLGIDLPRHRRHVRPVHQRASWSAGPSGPARRGRARHQVRQRARRGRRAAWASTAGRTTCARPATPRSSGWAWTTSTSTTSTAWTRPCRSRRRSAPWPTWCSAGKVRHLGLSEAAPATIRRAHARAPDHRAADRVLPLDPRPRGRGPAHVCRELGIGFVAYSPLGRGFLTGRFRTLDDFPTDDYRRNSPALPGRELPEEPRPGRAGGGRSRSEKRCTPSQLALAWVLAQGDDIVPDPRHQAAEVPGGERRALEVELTPADLERDRRGRRRRASRPASGTTRRACGRSTASSGGPPTPATPAAPEPPPDTPARTATAGRARRTSPSPPGPARPHAEARPQESVAR